MNNPEVLIIPDVHGRTFWKDAINKFPKDKFPQLKIIFLGDYLDPYTFLDNISNEDAFYNFEDIIHYAKSDSRIILLIGNHDWHYFVNLDNCRMDYARSRNIERIFRENMDMFSLIKILEFAGIKYMFTHAGITEGWVRDIMAMAQQEINEWKTNEEFPVKEEDPRYIWISEVAKVGQTHNYEWVLNECLKNYNVNFYSCVPSMISRERGGWYPHGSLIWADVHEHLYADKELRGYYQIFGHTISFPQGNPKAYAISPEAKSWAMLDASQAFIMDFEGNIKSIEELN